MDLKRVKKKVSAKEKKRDKMQIGALMGEADWIFALLHDDEDEEWDPEVLRRRWGRRKVPDVVIRTMGV